MRTMLLWVLLGMSAVLLNPANAGEAGGGGKKVRDRNGDGDRDGRAALREAIKEQLSKRGADGDGAREHLKALKEKLDADNDGKVDHGELQAAMEKLKENHPALYERIMKRVEERRERHGRREEK